MRQALEMALEALEDFHTDGYRRESCYDIIKAIEEALAQPEQEPVAFIDNRIHGFPDCFVNQSEPPHTSPVYTSSPQHKPLTENEIKHLWYEACQTNLELTSQLIVHLARAIEAAHNIKE